jgi:hypothetical protein
VRWNGATLAVERDFLPFGPGFRGGVRVALGDVDGDGIADIVSGAGPGTTPQVHVESGADGSTIWTFQAFAPGFTGGVYVAAGDVTGDGRADLVAGAGAGGAPQVRVWDGVDLTPLHSFLAYTPGFTGGVTVAAGDVDGDGRADIITGTASGGFSEVTVRSGVNLASLRDFFAFPPASTEGVFVAGADFDGDAAADLVVGAGSGSAPEVKVLRGTDLLPLATFFAFDPAFTGGVRVGAGQVDADGIADLVVGTGAGSSNVKVWSGPGTTLLWNFFPFGVQDVDGVFVAAGAPPPAPGSPVLAVPALDRAGFAIAAALVAFAALLHLRRSSRAAH